MGGYYKNEFTGFLKANDSGSCASFLHSAGNHLVTCSILELVVFFLIILIAVPKHLPFVFNFFLKYYPRKTLHYIYKTDILLVNVKAHPSAWLPELTGLRPFTMVEREQAQGLMPWFEIYSSCS